MVAIRSVSASSATRRALGGRLHAEVSAVGDSFVVTDAQSENGITLNGEACLEARLVHGDVIGINKFLLRFSNHALEVPENLEAVPLQDGAAAKPKDDQPTVHLDEGSAQALAEEAKRRIARQRAELLARGGESLGPPPESVLPTRRASLRWVESVGPSRPVGVWVGGMALGLALIVGLLALAL